MDGSLLLVLASVLIVVGVAYGLFAARGSEVSSHPRNGEERDAH